MQFFLWDKGAEQGPYSFAMVQSLTQQGKVSPKILARLDTGTDWKPLASFLPKPEKKAAPVSASKPRWSPETRKVVAIVAGVLLLVLAGAWVVSANQKRIHHQAIAAKVARSREALNELKKLQGVTDGGISFLEYSRRVLDTKAAFSVLMDGESMDAEEIYGANQSLSAAMDDYVAAKNFWSHCITNSSSGSDLAPFDEEERAPYLKYGFSFINGHAGANLVPFIWRHASGNLEMAEFLLSAAEKKK